MEKIVEIISYFLGLSGNGDQSKASSYELNYDNLIYIDAENLPERGIKEAYEEIKPQLNKYSSIP